MSEHMNLDERILRDDNELMKDKDTISRYFNDIVTSTLFIMKNCPKDRVWKANPFRNTGKV